MKRQGQGSGVFRELDRMGRMGHRGRIKLVLIQLFDPDVSDVQPGDGLEFDAEQPRPIVRGLGIVIHQHRH